MYSSFENWRSSTTQEKQGIILFGIAADPQFVFARSSIMDESKIKKPLSYSLSPGSPLINKALAAPKACPCNDLVELTASLLE